VQVGGKVAIVYANSSVEFYSQLDATYLQRRSASHYPNVSVLSANQHLNHLSLIVRESNAQETKITLCQLQADHQGFSRTEVACDQPASIEKALIFHSMQGTDVFLFDGEREMMCFGEEKGERSG
jgi:hypothetical protein